MNIYLGQVSFKRFCEVPDGPLVAVDLLTQEVHLVDGLGLYQGLQEIFVHFLHRIDLWPPEEIQRASLILIIIFRYN